MTQQSLNRGEFDTTFHLEYTSVSESTFNLPFQNPQPSLKLKNMNAGGLCLCMPLGNVDSKTGIAMFWIFYKNALHGRLLYGGYNLETNTLYIVSVGI